MASFVTDSSSDRMCYRNVLTQKSNTFLSFMYEFTNAHSSGMFRYTCPLLLTPSRFGHFPDHLLGAGVNNKWYVQLNIPHECAFLASYINKEFTLMYGTKHIKCKTFCFYRSICISNAKETLHTLQLQAMFLFIPLVEATIYRCLCFNSCVILYTCL